MLTKYILLEDRRRNVENSLRKLLDMGVIPIVNENDTVAIDELELEVGENDSLAAIVAEIAKAELLVIAVRYRRALRQRPENQSGTKLIPVVERIDEHIVEMAGGAGTSRGTGGMKQK